MSKKQIVRRGRKSYLSINVTDSPHGTRARYVGGRCRCDECKGANRAYYHHRMLRADEAALDVKPSGPPLPGILVRAGRTHNVWRCPGANGSPCVVEGGSWLRGKHSVCRTCVERATVWNGLVPATRARRHLLKLRRAGVGYKSVAASCDIASSALSEIIGKRKTQIRKTTEARILAVDVGARAGGANVPAAPSLVLIDRMLARGFTRGAIAVLLGGKTRALQFGPRPMMTLERATAIERLWRRVERCEVQPDSPFELAGPVHALLLELEGWGLDQRWLFKHLGFTVHLRQPPTRMRRENAARVRALHAELTARRREGDLLPEGWEVPEASGSIGAAFGYDGGWGWEQRTSKMGKKREERELVSLAKTKSPSQTSL